MYVTTTTTDTPIEESEFNVKRFVVAMDPAAAVSSVDSSSDEQQNTPSLLRFNPGYSNASNFEEFGSEELLELLNH